VKRRRLVIGVAALVGALVILFGVNEALNASARSELEQACVCAEDVAARARANMGYLHDIYGDDANEVYRAMEHEVSAPCEELPDRLSFGNFNLGRSWAPTRSAERAAELEAIVERSRDRCREAHLRHGRPRSMAEALCQSLFTELTRDPATLSMPIWDWPVELKGTMCDGP